MPDVHKIAVIRANGVGDFMFSLPALDALKAAYPDAELVLLGKGWHKDFCTARPGPVDRVEVLPAIRGVGADDGADLASEDEVDDFCARMREERFDLAFQIHGGGRYSNPFVARLGARLTVGLRTPDAMPLDRYVPYLYFQPEVLRYLEVVSLVGASPLTLEPRVNLTELDMIEADAVGLRNERVVLIHPGATDGRRRWPAEKFAAVADLLIEAGATVALSGTEVERSLLDELRASMHYEPLDLCGRLGLGGLAAFMARCDLVISNDTGPVHVGAAVGAKTVGIYWAGNMINGGALTRSRHRLLASWRMECSECGQNCMEGRCAHSSSFVADVPVEEVAEAAFELLGLGPELD